MKSSIIVLMFVLAAIFSTSCGDSISSSKDIIFPDSNVSFNYQVSPFLKLNCAYSGCHSDESQAGGVRLTYYSNMFMSPGLIINGDADKSRLIQILENKLPHFTFFYRGNITENHLKGMRTWVNEGAKNN